MLFELLNGNRWEKQKMLALELNDCYRFIKQFTTIYGCANVKIIHRPWATIVVIMGPVGMESGRFTMQPHTDVESRLKEFTSW